jgi:CspA family cold shock protein
MSIQGEVKWFDPKKGYGFIVGPEGQDVFVHFSQIMGDGFRSLKDGEQVEYDLSEGDKGLQAREVKRTEVTEDAAEPQAAHAAEIVPAE